MEKTCGNCRFWESPTDDYEGEFGTCDYAVFDDGLRDIDGSETKDRWELL